MVWEMLFTCLLVILAVDGIKAQCSVTDLEDGFGSIKYFPEYVHGSNQPRTITCDWKFATATESDFLLIINLDYLLNYQSNDVVTLPDGNQYEGHEINAHAPTKCFKYKPQRNSTNADCMAELERRYCPTVSSKTVMQPATLLINTTENIDEYTNIIFTYVIAACPSNQTLPTTATPVKTAVSNSTFNLTHFNSSRVVQTTGWSIRDRLSTNRSIQSTQASTAIVASTLSVLLVACLVVIAILFMKLRRKTNPESTVKNPHPDASTDASQNRIPESGIYVEPNIVLKTSEQNSQLHAMAANNEEDAAYDHLDESSAMPNHNDYDMATEKVTTKSENL